MAHTDALYAAGPTVAPQFSFAALVELLKPVTWFAPMWAFGCGAVSGGPASGGKWALAVAGIVLAGPLVCGTSQAVNDWFDRHVDAINEPGRPIPSGRISVRAGLAIAIGATVLSLVVAALLGTWVLGAATVGLLLAWAYSAPPLRLKQNGWWGNAACGACYEGLPWVTGAAIVSGGAPGLRIIAVAALYSLGAHGIMTLNDFKSVEGDRRSRVRSLPVQLGVDGAARLACAVMTVAQIGVILLLLYWDLPIYAAILVALLGAQLLLMPTLLRDPRGFAPRYNASGTSLYVLGMLAVAFALGHAG